MSVLPADIQDLLLTTPRLRREQRTIRAMLQIWCEAQPLHHRPRHGELCAGCAGLFEYASYRLVKCPYGEDKPTCVNCPIHCYGHTQRAAMQEVMRFSGPKMLFRHPVLAIRHLMDGREEPPLPPRKKAPGKA